MTGSAARRRALVTGASSGIGLAFATVLAEHGCDLILTARRAERLDQIAADLRQRFGIEAAVMPADLSDRHASERLTSEMSHRSLHVDILINNAGYGVPGRYSATTWAEQEKFLQVLVAAVAELSHRLLPAMVERRWGRIINVASLAGLLPGVAGHTLYAAAKAFVIKFSESLALETAPYGIHVTASCPGFTRSEFHDVTGTRAQVDTMPAFMWLDADAVARGSYEAVMTGRPVYVPGGVNRTLSRLGRFLPRPVVAGLMTRSAGKFRRV